MLASIASKIGDPELKNVASKAVREVRKQEQAHLNWNEQTLNKLAMESSVSAPEQEATEEEEAME